MFEQADQYLKDWAGKILPDTSIDLAAPQEAATGQGVSLYLISLESKPPTYENTRQAWQIGLNYLVTTWAGDPETAHRLLGELVFAALENTEFEIELGKLPADTWTSYRLVPRPYFVIKFPVRKPRQGPVAKYVTQPLSVKEAALTKLYGQVLGPGDVPLSGAQVTIPALRLVHYTDPKGRFILPLVPGSSNLRTVQVKFKSQVLEVTPNADQPNSETTPLVIRFDLPEE
jgi:hypothetical protein